MTEKICKNCKNVIEEPIEVMKCKLGYEISKDGIPGPDCDGKYFEPKWDM